MEYVVFIFYALFVCNIENTAATPVDYIGIKKLENTEKGIYANAFVEKQKIDKERGTIKGENKEEAEDEERMRKANVPKYMRDLYKALNKYADEELLYNGNIVRSFSDQGTAKSERNLQRYQFDISRTNQDKETLTKAELRIFKFPNKKKNSLTGYIQIDVEDIYSKKIVSSRISSVFTSGWQVFPLTDIVKTWIAEKSKNKGIRVSLRSLYGDKEEVTFATKEKNSREPMLVVYTKDKSELTLASLLKWKLNTTALFTKKTSDPLNQEHDKNHKRERRTASNYDLCHMEKLSVPLNEIGWDKNFASPSKFQINQCKGFCRHDSTNGNKQTNHALIQALYAAVTGGRTVSYPCCAPSKYTSGTALVVDRLPTGETVELVYLKKMTVTSCECL